MDKRKEMIEVAKRIRERADRNSPNFDMTEHCDDAERLADLLLDEPSKQLSQELEAQLQARQAWLERLQREFENDVNEYYRPLVEAACLAKNFEKAWAIAIRVPDCVSRVFLIDTVRQARGDYADKVDDG